MSANGKHTAIEITATPATGKPGRFVAVATNGVAVLCHDVIDLNSARSRKQFVGEAMQAAFPDLSSDDRPAEVRAEMHRQLTALATCPPGAGTPPADAVQAEEDLRVAELAKMPDDIKAAALAMLLDPKLLERVSADIEASGVVGEKKNRLLIYLAGTSAQLDRPISVIVRGGSSSGKSFLVEKVSSFFPPEVVLRATSLTTNALYYFPAGTLRHRFVVGGERSRIVDDDQAETTRALREMIESGRLSKAVPIKEGERITTRLIEQEGPISYVETTTLNNIFNEDANRSLLLNSDERNEQTRRIMDATAADADGKTRVDIERIRSIHHAIQRMIPRVKVDIPFARAIAANYPDERLESRRDFRHLLQLVRAVALLHFHQRERSQAGAVIATLADYEVAESLAREPLGAAASGVSKGAKLYLARLQDKLDPSKAGTVFTSTEAEQVGKEMGGASKRTRYNQLIELHGAGAVEQTEASRGKVPAKWKLTGLDPDAGDGVVPTLEQVMRSLADCKNANDT